MKKPRLFRSSVFICSVLLVMLIASYGAVYAQQWGGGGMSRCVLGYDNCAIGLDSRGVSGCNYVHTGNYAAGKIHVSSYYVEQLVPNHRNFQEIGYAWEYGPGTHPNYFWAIMIENQYFGGPNGLLGAVSTGTNHQYHIYMAYYTTTPWPGYRWYFLIDNQLRAELQCQINMGQTKCSSERNATGCTNYSHFWYMFSMSPTLGDWRAWSNLQLYYDSDSGYDLNKVNNTDCYVQAG